MSLKNNKRKRIREIFTSPAVEELLKDNKLNSFDRIWSLQAPWFEEPNERREGVSGVVTWQLKLPDGSEQRVFIKRQENHNTPTCRHPFRGEPTFYREYQNIQKLTAIGVPTIEVLYYGEAVSQGKRQAILISKGLDEYDCLENWFRQPENRNDPERLQPLLKKLATVIRPMHQDKIRHGCLYGKHIFVKTGSDPEGHPAFKIRLLDLEKAKTALFRRRAVEKDLSQLVRHTDGFDEQAVELFLSYYFDGAELARWRSRLISAIRHKDARRRQKGDMAA